jgi:hypothetical protein
MLNTLMFVVAFVGQHHVPGHSGHHGMAAHPGMGGNAALEHQIMQDMRNYEMSMQQQRQQEYQHHIFLVNQDRPRVENHLKKMNYDRKYWSQLSLHHKRLGVETFWRLARTHKEIDKLLTALKEERAWEHNSTGDRLSRLKARRESWDLLAESRFFTYLKERKFDHKHWENLRFYYERLGPETFWRVAKDHKEHEPFKHALSIALRQKLLEPEATPN